MLLAYGCVIYIVECVLSWSYFNPLSLDSFTEGMSLYAASTDKKYTIYMDAELISVGVSHKCYIISLLFFVVRNFLQ